MCTCLSVGMRVCVCTYIQYVCTDTHTQTKVCHSFFLFPLLRCSGEDGPSPTLRSRAGGRLGPRADRSPLKSRDHRRRAFFTSSPRPSRDEFQESVVRLLRFFSTVKRARAALALPCLGWVREVCRSTENGTWEPLSPRPQRASSPALNWSSFGNSLPAAGALT